MRGISQEELADLAGLHRTYVGSVERSERNISIDNLAKLASALEISLSALLEEEIN
jgi:transcriptional regulator with XRE-family HTH domain